MAKFNKKKTMGFKISKVLEPENAIKSIAEIPMVLEEEKVKQPIIYLTNTINGKKRDVVLMGEIHIATEGETRAANRILPYFKYLGCEGVDVRGFIEGRLFFWFMDNIIDRFIWILFFGEKRSKKNKSSLDKAKEYYDSGIWQKI